ncbi:YggT family protein [bacterium]|nr:YggT family protein [candidate division CSSED10-310 bacterium]
MNELIVMVFAWLFNLLLLLLLVRVAMYHVRMLFDPFANPIYRLTEPLLRPLRPVTTVGTRDLSPHAGLLLVVLLRGLFFGALGGGIAAGVRLSFYDLFTLLLQLIAGAFFLSAMLPAYSQNWLVQFLQEFARLFLRFLPVRRVWPRVLIGVVMMVAVHALVTLPLVYYGSRVAGGATILTIHLAESFLALTRIVDFFIVVVLVGALMTWVSPDPRNPIVQIVWGISEPLLRPFRGILPLIAGLDLSPILAILAMSLGASVYKYSIHNLVNVLV